MSVRAYLLLLLMLSILVGGFLYLRALGRLFFVEMPPQAEESVRTRLNEVALQPGAGPSQTATLYFPSPDDDRLVAESRPVTWAETDADRIRQVLLALVEGSRQGLGRALPASTNLRAVFLTSDGTAYVDFSNELLTELTPGIETESLVVYSIVNSLTANIPSVKRVKILIQGQEAETLDGHVDLSAAFVPDPARIQTAPQGP